MNLTNKQVKEKYNRYSLVYDLFQWPLEKVLFSKWRKNLLREAQGRVLEIGVGTGKNLPYYNPYYNYGDSYEKVRLTAIDISAEMLRKAQKKVKEVKEKQKKATGNLPVKLQLVNSENLPFKDNHFDCIVNTFVLCSVSDPEMMLKEMKRVLKAQGRILMLEHVLSKNKLIAFFEKVHNPLTKFFLGVNINRNTTAAIKKAGLKIVKEKNLALVDVFKEIEVRKY
ncbi:MAG: class I SAM-dependent methyltransferase [Nanoarchaeota archaeon]